MSVPLLRVTRSGLVESVHAGDVAVCDASGRLLASAGDPDHVAFARSCMKPVQAAVSLAAIGGTLADPTVAVMCSSHNGEPGHVRAVRRQLGRGGLDDTALRTPAARPFDADAAARVRMPAPIYHDCSGNHAGMLVASVAAGWPVDRYRERGHPHHRRVLPLVRELAGAEPVIGVDGCGIPVHGVSLRALATLYARMAVSDDPHVRRGPAAMRSEPWFVGGTGRADTAVMTAVPDLVMKEGAEALVCAASIRDGVGVAVKVADGSDRAAGPATIEVLDQLQLLPASARRALRHHARPRVLGADRRVGVVEPVLTLSVRRS